MRARFAFAEFEQDETPVLPDAVADETPLVWSRVAGVAEVLPWNGPVRRIVERSVSRPRVRRKRFAAPSAAKARIAAGEWLHDFSGHGPLDIRRIKTDRHRDVFLTTVIYTRG
jgi:hypothetical protein